MNNEIMNMVLQIYGTSYELVVLIILYEVRIQPMRGTQNIHRKKWICNIRNNSCYYEKTFYFQLIPLPFFMSIFQDKLSLLLLGFLYMIHDVVCSLGVIIICL